MLVDFDQLDHDSKVWIYQSDRLISPQQVKLINEDLFNFLDHWTAHNVQLPTFGKVYYDRFVVLFADDRRTGTSGCSIDKSIHFIENLEQKYGISLLGRTKVAYINDSSNFSESDIRIADLNQLNTLQETGQINYQTRIFDNLVKTKGEFLTQWIKPLEHSWHKRFV